MSENLPQFRNGISVDAEMEKLCVELDVHELESSLPSYGLILAYNFPPFADASSATVAKRIRQLGRQVDVVSQDMSSIRKLDNDLTSLVSDFVSKNFQLSGQPGFATWASICNYILDGYSAVKRQLQSHQYSFVYSRSMFPATHFLAAFIKTRHPEILWISEFSDPVRHDVEGKARISEVIPDDYVATKLKSKIGGIARTLLVEDQSVFAWCDVLGVIVADRVIFTNKNQRDVMLEPYGKYVLPAQLEEKAVVSPHPTLSSEFYNTPTSLSFLANPSDFNIGYFGEFYPNRSVGELVRAVGGLDAKTRNKIKVHVFTSNVGAAQESLKELSFDTSFVKIKNSKNLFAFLKLASEMDALYVCDVSIGLGYKLNPYLPSKLSDYLGANVPIIASIWPRSIISESRSIKQFLIGDILGLRLYLAGLIRENTDPI